MSTELLDDAAALAASKKPGAVADKIAAAFSVGMGKVLTRESTSER